LGPIAKSAGRFSVGVILTTIRDFATVAALVAAIAVAGTRARPTDWQLDGRGFHDGSNMAFPMTPTFYHLSNLRSRSVAHSKKRTRLRRRGRVKSRGGRLVGIVVLAVRYLGLEVGIIAKKTMDADLLPILRHIAISEGSLVAWRVLQPSPVGVDIAAETIANELTTLSRLADTFPELATRVDRLIEGWRDFAQQIQAKPH
jgi:hypothetical protein